MHIFFVLFKIIYISLQYIPLKHDQSPCRGQGDEAINSVLSPKSATSSLIKSVGDLEKICAEAATKADLNNTVQLTYTTLLPRQENAGSLVNVRILPLINSIDTDN